MGGEAYQKHVLYSWSASIYNAPSDVFRAFQIDAAYMYNALLVSIYAQYTSYGGKYVAHRRSSLVSEPMGRGWGGAGGGGRHAPAPVSSVYVNIEGCLGGLQPHPCHHSPSRRVVRMLLRTWEPIPSVGCWPLFGTGQVYQSILRS